MERMQNYKEVKDMSTRIYDRYIKRADQDKKRLDGDNDKDQVKPKKITKQEE